MSESVPLPSAAQKAQRLIRLPEVMNRVGLKRSAIYQRMSEGRFPKSHSLGIRYTVWLETDIDAWIEAALAEPAVVQPTSAA